MAIKVKIGGDATGAKKAASDARKGIKGLGAEGKKAGKSMTVSFIKANLALGALKIGARAVAGAFSTIGKGAIEAGANMESFEVQLETLLGSADEASERIEKLFEIGSTTPFNLEELVRAEVKLEAFGVTGDRARQAVMDLGSFMEGDLVGAADAVGRAFQGGAGAADILRDKGILAMVSLQAGTKATNLSLQDFREALIDTLTDPDGKIAGGTARLGETFKGLVSNLEDEWFKFQKTIADAGAFDATKLVLIDVLALIDENRDATKEWAGSISTGIVDGLLLAYETLGLIADAVTVVRSAWSQLNAVFTQGMADATRERLEAMKDPEMLITHMSAEARKALIVELGNELIAWEEITAEHQKTADILEGTDSLYKEIRGRVEGIRAELAEMAKESANTETETGGIKDNLEGASDAVDDIAGSPFMSNREWNAITREMEKMAGVIDEEREHFEKIAGLTMMIEDAVKAGIIDEEERVRLYGLLLDASGKRLLDEEAITAEKKKQKAIDEAAEREARLIGAVSTIAGGLSGGAGSFMTAGVGAGGAWGALIMAAISAAERDEETGQFAIIAQNDAFQAQAENFADEIGNLIIDMTKQVPEHLAAAFKTVPGLAENLIEGLSEATEDLIPALIEALVNGLSDPMHGVKLAGMIIRGIIGAFVGIMEELNMMIDEWLQDFIESMMENFSDGILQGFQNIGEAIDQWFIDLIEALTGLDVSDQGPGKSPGLSEKSRDDERGVSSERTAGGESDDRAARTTAGLDTGTDSGATDERIIVQLVQNFDTERFGLEIDVSQIDVVRRGQAVSRRLATAISTVTTRTSGGG